MSVSIGNELRDGYKRTNGWVQNNIQFLLEIEQFYKERAQLEREYSTKLQTLTGEYFKKKANKSISLTVGDSPIFTPGSLEAASLTTWNEILSQTESTAKIHANLSNDLSLRISGKISQLQQVLQLFHERVEQFQNEKLDRQKNEIFENVQKYKKRYDDACNSMESTRAKAEKSTNKAKYDRKLKEKQVEMNNCKNEYLIKINIANRIKDKYYFQDLPEVLDLLQNLNEYKTKEVNLLLKQQLDYEIGHLQKTIANYQSATTLIAENKCELDTQMFIKHNQLEWKEPGDFYYVPSTIWHDDENFITEPNELVNLKKILKIAKETDGKYQDILNDEKQMLNQLQTTRVEYKNIDELNDQFDAQVAIDTLNKYLTTLSSFVNDENTKITAQVEIETIQNNAGDKDLSLDGLVITTKKSGGLFSKLRGNKTQTVIDTDNVELEGNNFSDSASTYTANSHNLHSFNISNVFNRHRGISVSSSNTVPEQQQQQLHSRSASTISTGGLQGTARYAYTAQGDDEVSIAASESFTVDRQDDGSGWTLISKNSGEQGLVPTSYIEVSQTVKKKGPEVAPRRNAKRIQYVTAKFAYQSQGDDEISIQPGDKIAVLEPDENGWTKGDLNGVIGLFPTSYTE